MKNEVRPIDAIELQQKMCALCNQDCSDEPCEPSDCVFIRAINEMLTLTPPNEPLTLEQLREMKDKPAYLKVFDPLLKSGWHIIKAVTEDKIIFRGWQTVYVPIDGMGVDYNLYRRPPEGEEENACRM